MNREEHLQKTFPTEEGKTYIQSLDEFNSKSGLRELFKEIHTPEYKEKCIQRNEEYLQQASMDYQLGFYVGEYIVNRYLPTLSTDALHSRNVIEVTEEDALENKILDDEWFKTTKYQDNWGGEEDGDKEKWNLYHQHNKMLEKKYLPPVLECVFSLIRIIDMKLFKTGLIHSLWGCDMCSYNLDEENIEIKNDMEIGFTHIKFKLDEKVS
jgi:hypothetical protein